MCIAPLILPEIGPVACRFCWQCRRDRVNDLIGRCIAEQSASDGVIALTLTYAGDVAGSSFLRYLDFQHFIMRLRRKRRDRVPYKVRYIVAGEFGSRKGRAHWHAILFFKGKVPDIELEKRVNWDFWPHGFVFAQMPDYGGFAYVLKYVLKDEAAEFRSGHLAMSKKPPLGHEWFMGLAQDHVEKGLSPQSRRYYFRDLFDPKGKRRMFCMRGRMRELYCERYIEGFRERHGREYPFSEFLELQEDIWVARDLDRSWSDEEWQRHLAARPLVRRFEYWGSSREQPVQMLVGETLAVWRFADGSIEVGEGDDHWRVENEKQLDAALRVLEADQSKDAAHLRRLVRGNG